MTARKRSAIADKTASIADMNPLADFDSLCCACVHDVGQGDAISIYGHKDSECRLVMRFDYGGKEGSPFKGPDDINTRLDIGADDLLMLSHWDEDHWCAARKGTSARTANWLVPRQLTSPRAVEFSTTVEKLRTIPETPAQRPFAFRARNGDTIWWEKLGAFPGVNSEDEDCNKTGVVLALQRGTGGNSRVILLPGDAPFHRSPLYRDLFAQKSKLVGLVAFHHGAGTHWTRTTERMLREWTKTMPFDVVFSCSETNSYGHPDENRYRRVLGTSVPPPLASYYLTGMFRPTGIGHCIWLW